MENNFEKQVRQKMDELRVKPAEEVWHKVAAAIVKRKADRRVFVVVLLFLLLTGSVIFIFRGQTAEIKNDKALSQSKNSTQTNRIDQPVGDSSIKQSSISSNTPRIPGKDSTTNFGIQANRDITITKKSGDQASAVTAEILKKPGSVATHERDKNSNIAITKEASINVHGDAKKTRYKMGQKVNVSITQSNPVEVIDETLVSHGIISKAVVTDIPLISYGTKKMQVSNSIGSDKIEIKQFMSEPLAMILPAKKDSLKRSVKGQQGSEWKLGFIFSLGLATTQNGYLGIIGSGAGDAGKVYADPSQSSTGSAGQGAYIPHIPSKISGGTGLVLGVYVQKNISSRIDFLLGLNYRTYSSAMMVGNRVDSIYNFSSSNFFYRTGSATRYKNHFRFLEVPVSIRFKLSKQNRAPFYLNTGISMSRLFGSNALQFDTSSGSYYKNNTVFNKTQLNISTGLLFSLSGHAKNPLMVGPDINFSLTKMSNSGLYTNRHYSYFGIQVQKNIGKK